MKVHFHFLTELEKLPVSRFITSKIHLELIVSRLDWLVVDFNRSIALFHLLIKLSEVKMLSILVRTEQLQT